ncbi:collagen alpha-1(XII) chain-like, partial [Lingula anatina]|uniref:Collagen alpha-1(XII) chain-like n=1 Tax=Lingula anatina TaxID=7574 RepID=A0A1S3HJY7_LINAN
MECACKNSDIAFLLDVTGSPDDAPKIQRFLAYLVNDSFVIGPSDVNIAIISFIPEIDGHMTLDKGDLYPDVSAAILTVNVHNGTSFESQTYNALDLAKTVFLSPQHVQGGRLNASKIAVVLTTGLDDTFCTTVQKALAAKQQGIEVYAIGVGNKTSQLLELKAIVSPPAHTHAFHVESFDELRELAEVFFKALCS